METDKIRVKSYELKMPDSDTYMGIQNIADRFKEVVKPIYDVAKSMSVSSSIQAMSAMRENFISEMTPILRSYTEQSIAQMMNFSDIAKPMKQSFVMDFADISNGFKAINEQAKNLFVESMNYDYANSFKEVISSFSTMMSGIQSEQLNQLIKVDYSKIFPDISSWTDSFNDVLNMTYEAIQEEQWEEENTELETDFSSIEEIQESIQEQFSNPEKFHKRIARWAKVKIKKFFTFSSVLLFVYSIFIEPYLQQNIGMPVMAYIESNVKDLPQKGAEVACRIKEGVIATIIENTNYYYKVSFTDENGVVHEGYVAKRNLKLIQQDEEEAEETEESEETEVGNE